MGEFKKLFPYSLIALLIGVGLASFFAIHNGIIALLALAITAIALLYRSKRLFVVACMVACVLLGIVRYEMWSETPRDGLMESHLGAKVIIEGVVGDEPDVRENSTNLTVSVRSIRSGDTLTNAFGLVQVSAPRYPEYDYGDVLRVEGKLMHPKKFSEKDGRVFDYPAYLAVKGIHYQIPFPGITRIGTREGDPVLRALFTIKHKFLGVLSTLFPEPENALLGGLLLGGKQSLGSAWQDIFRKAGIVHVVVLSGYNMTIVSEWLVALFGFLGFYGSLSVGGVGIMLFALMTGAGATVLRAALMAGIALVARATGRTYTMGRALLIAGVCMVLQSPSILAFDPSFQLSFLASLGLIFVSPIIERQITLFTRFPIWREVFVSTLATQALVLPLLLYQTGVFSVVSLPVNMLVLPVIPLTMFFGFVAGIFAVLVPPLGALIALPAHVLLSWILFVAHTSIQIPYAALSAPISGVAVFMLYLLITFFLWRAHVALPRESPRVAPR